LRCWPLTRLLSASFRAYASDTLSRDDIERVLNSIADSNNYQAAAAAPVIRMIEYLKQYIDPKDDSKADISISWVLPFTCIGLPLPDTIR